MSTPILYALNTIKQKIPKRILELAFLPKQYNQLRRDPFMPGNIDDEIVKRVIYGRVKLDSDMVGANEILISLDGIVPEIIANDKYIYHIPKERTGGRSIVSALAIVLFNNTNINPYSAGLMGTQGTSTSMCNRGKLNPVQAMGSSVQPHLVTQTTNVSVLGDNAVLVEDILAPGPYRHLRCLVGYDTQLTSMQQAAWKAFAHLCVLATKAYIYNNLIIDLDQAQLVGGQELGIVKEKIESYSEADDLYEEYFSDTWRKVQYFGDNTRNVRHIKSLIGRYK